ncbi:hypothetical protein Ah1_00323 [Aeromonas phage Ah1]|uniref:DUF4326 domain-containing protein n=1 Tax=Aeromonas phage Ah1 TaxID=2053701 RepID=A0A2H4YF95_9CAUD|nr:hypothetical protein KNT77_gp195 [Aeromonas phage Ah1]AUE22841.1 hypothetical protein Ah1_00323 [Aeromonas phage Ah1]
MCYVVNKYKMEFDVDIQRGTIWGNPHKDGTRTENIEQFKNHLKDQIRRGNITKEMLLSLHGKRLGCTCSPLPCHGDIIAVLVNKLAGTHTELDI